MATGVNDNLGLEVVCDLLRGPAPTLGEQVETWRTAGIDGVGAQKTGKGGDEFTFTAIKFGSSAAINTWYGQMRSQLAKLCTVTDDHGDAYTSLLILEVSQLNKTMALPHPMRGEVRVRAVKTN